MKEERQAAALLECTAPWYKTNCIDLHFLPCFVFSLDKMYFVNIKADKVCMISPSGAAWLNNKNKHKHVRFNYLVPYLFKWSCLIPFSCSLLRAEESLLCVWVTGLFAAAGIRTNFGAQFEQFLPFSVSVFTSLTIRCGVWLIDGLVVQWCCTRFQMKNKWT